MRHTFLLARVALALVALVNSTSAWAQGKCRMEQQCHWENFKKVCVWVKVCR
jgi:hypothetical protein